MLSQRQANSIINDEGKQNFWGVWAQEETYEMITDNYFQMLTIYRIIVKEEKEFDKIYKKAQNAKPRAKAEIKTIVKNLRNDLKFISDEDERKAEEKAANKKIIKQENIIKNCNYILEEAEIDIIIETPTETKVLTHTPIVQFVLEHRKFFEKVDRCDCWSRKKIGKIGNKVIKGWLWPIRKTFNKLKKWDKEDTSHLDKVLNFVKDWEDKFEKSITNPS